MLDVLVVWLIWVRRNPYPSGDPTGNGPVAAAA